MKQVQFWTLYSLIMLAIVWCVYSVASKNLLYQDQNGELQAEVTKLRDESHQCANDRDTLLKKTQEQENELELY